MRECRLLLTVLLGLLLAPGSSGLRAQPSPPVLDLTLNRTSIVPGQQLIAGVSVTNPGGGPAADFVFAILLPDGATIVSTGPGVGVRFGQLANLRSIVPVARGIPLGGPFQYQHPSFFAYDFGGAEPLGTYRFIFAAFTAGALDDGAIGAGELLALTTRDVTVSLGPQGTVDTSRTATASFTPAQGGTVQTVRADGTVLRLTAPAGAVNVSTQVTIAPLTGMTGLPPGRFIAGVKAGPSGQRFQQPATLRIELPPSFVMPPLGLAGFVVDDDGRNLEFVPVAVTGNVVTLPVTHFSAAGVAVFDDWMFLQCGPEDIRTETYLRACGDLQSLEQVERLRMIEEGDDILSQAFLDRVRDVLDIWLETSLLRRLFDAGTPDPDDPLPGFQLIDNEWLTWVFFYESLFGNVTDRANAAAGRPLGTGIDLAQDRYRVAAEATMNAANQRCLADKANVKTYVDFVFTLSIFWDFQAHSPLPFEQRYCVDVAIDAAPPPVLTAGQAAQMPIDIRARFSDGTEMTGQSLSVSIAATNATVTPAGGILSSPVARQLTLVPTGTSSLVTIAAGFTGSGTLLDYVRPRTRVFPAGGPAPEIAVVSSSIGSSVELRASGLAATPVSESGGNQGFDAEEDLGVTMSGTVQNQVGTVGYTGSGNTLLRRRVTRLPGELTVVFDAQSHLSLAPFGNLAPSVTGTVSSSVSDSWCADFPMAFNVEYLVPSAGLMMFNQNSGDFAIGGASTSGTVRVGSGRWCVRYARSHRRDFAGNVGPEGPPSATFTYAMTLRPAP